MPKKKKNCIACGGTLSCEEGDLCVGCCFLALYGGDKPGVKEVQRIIWQRILEHIKKGEKKSDF